MAARFGQDPEFVFPSLTIYLRVEFGRHFAETECNVNQGIGFARPSGDRLGSAWQRLQRRDPASSPVEFREEDGDDARSPGLISRQCRIELVIGDVLRIEERRTQK